jgi:hypothetical protein
MRRMFRRMMHHQNLLEISTKQRILRVKRVGGVFFLSKMRREFGVWFG